MLEGSWLWVALPVGVLGLIAALWFLVIAPGGSTPPRATATPPRTATVAATTTLAAIAVPTQAGQPTAEVAATPTVEPTAEPAPTAKPTTIGLGVRVEVAGTGASKLSVRQNPGTSAPRLKLVPDGTQLVVVGGPESANGLTWWKVDDQAGLVGWVAADYLQLAE